MIFISNETNGRAVIACWFAAVRSLAAVRSCHAAMPPRGASI